jgi:outer membrane protein OmpA-like peptidoglycan-associated protein
MTEGRLPLEGMLQKAGLLRLPRQGMNTGPGASPNAGRPPSPSPRPVGGPPGQDLARTRSDRTMSRDGKIQEPDGAPAAVREWPARRQPARLLSVVLLAVVALLAVAGGLSWLAQGRHVAELEQPLAAAKVERDTGSVRAEQRQAALNQAKAEREALDARRLELERRFAAAREDLTRLRAEAASSRAQVAAAREEPATEAWNTPTLAPASPPAAIAGTAVPTTGAAAASPPASASTAGEHATGEPGVEAIEARLASAAAADSPAAPESGPAAAGQRLTEAETAVVAPEPSAGLAAEVESLTVTFDVNSSYLPASLDGRLRRLAERLERGRRYEVELTASVGAGPVANAEDPDAAARYNAWLAERRLDRVATFLQDNAEADALAIEREFAAGDPSRRVVVRVRPLS